ncbi:MAG TPA: HipA domain-containing protein, partial [Candidatus Melainabacteria bacterium]|nr:HipA domain-containing protein [Candidatus Melainabacteria bacterium]
LHMQSLGAMAHYDFNMAKAYSYEQALLVMKKLNLSMDEVEEQFRRMVFNVVCRNQDDHVKNIAFLMNKADVWSLSPAFDVTYAYNPSGKWTGQHQMSINGKTDDFAVEDFEACAKTASLKRGRARDILEQVQLASLEWPNIAEEAGVPRKTIKQIRKAHRFF